MKFVSGLLSNPEQWLFLDVSMLLNLEMPPSSMGLLWCLAISCSSIKDQWASVLPCKLVLHESESQVHRPGGSWSVFSQFPPSDLKGTYTFEAYHTAACQVICMQFLRLGLEIKEDSQRLFSSLGDFLTNWRKEAK